MHDAAGEVVGAGVPHGAGHGSDVATQARPGGGAEGAGADVVGVVVAEEAAAGRVVEVAQRGDLELAEGELRRREVDGDDLAGVIEQQRDGVVAGGGDGQHAIARRDGEGLPQDTDVLPDRAVAQRIAGAVASFAGQHHTTLGARDLDEVKAAVAACLASFAHEGVAAYRAAHGLVGSARGPVLVVSCPKPPTPEIP